jgi:hypothetical protein
MTAVGDVAELTEPAPDGRPALTSEVRYRPKADDAVRRQAGRLMPSPSRIDSSGGHSVTGNSETEYLNVDLEIWSRSDLQPLVDAFGDRVTALHVGRIKGRHFAGLELTAMTKTADQTIRRLAALVESLPRAARRLWNKAERREFNLGIKAGQNQYAFRCLVDPEALRALSDIDGRVVITVYGSSLGELPASMRRPTVR